jgi:hypothetical protein
VRLAPFYDLLCITVYPNLKKSFSFKIGDRWNLDQIRKEDINHLENAIGIRENTIVSRLRDMCAEVSSKAAPLAREIMEAYPESRMPERVAKLIEKRFKGMKMLSLL